MMKKCFEDRLYNKILDATGSSIGRFFLKMARPSLQFLFPKERCSKSVEEVLSDLGYHHALPEDLEKFPIRVLHKNVKGLLSSLGEAKFDNIFHGIKEDFDKSYGGVAIYGCYTEKEMPLKTSYIIMPDMRDIDAQSEVAKYSRIPFEYIEFLTKDKKLDQLQRLFHELTHFPLHMSWTHKFGRMTAATEIEARCDDNARRIVNSASTASLENDKEFLLIRAVAPFLKKYLYENREWEFSQNEMRGAFSHATALYLNEPERLPDEPMPDIAARLFHVAHHRQLVKNSGHDYEWEHLEKSAKLTSRFIAMRHDHFDNQIIDAYWSPIKKIQPNIDIHSEEPLFMQVYRELKQMMKQDGESLKPLQKEAVELYCEGVEYFSPSYAKRALMKTSQNLQCADNSADSACAP